MRPFEIGHRGTDSFGDLEEASQHQLEQMDASRSIQKPAGVRFSIMNTTFFGRPLLQP